MTKFSELSIKQQLTGIISLVSGIVLLLACTALVAYDQYVFLRTKKADLGLLAKNVGNDCRSALMFGTAYVDRAEKSLAALEKVPQFLSAAIYSTNALFAFYPPKGFVPSVAEPDGLPRFEDGRIVVFQSIFSREGDELGTIFLNFSMSERWDRLRMFVAAAAVICIGAFLLIYFLSSRFQRIISQPIFELADTARHVAEQKDYSARASRQTGGEIGFLTDQFNGMLAQIEQQDKELKDVNVQVRESEHRAQVATTAKSQFLANMSHELRTPLNAIIGFSEILADKTFGDFNEKQSRYVQNILTSGRHLLQLINDILDLAKIEAGKLVLDPAKFEVSSALRDVQVIVATLANKKKITLALEAAPGLPPVFADQPKFKQVMYNLLSNAIKFTPDGGRVTMKVALQQGDPGGGGPGAHSTVSAKAGDT